MMKTNDNTRSSQRMASDKQSQFSQQMQLKCSDIFKEAVLNYYIQTRTSNENLRYQLMSKACRSIAQILPFENMWVALLKQDQLLFYMLILQCNFGQNIKMLIELIIERMIEMKSFQVLFLDAAQQIFTQKYIFPDFITNKYDLIKKECVLQFYCFLKQLQMKEDHVVMQKVIETYQTFFSNLTDITIMMQLYNNLQSTVAKWPLILKISPLIFHDVENLISTSQISFVEVDIAYDEVTECESPLRSNSIRKDNQVVIELQRWLGKTNYEVPIITKRVANSVINSQSLFKSNDNIITLLSFIINPLKYDTSNTWHKIQAKVSLRDIINLKDTVNTLQSPAAHYHIRSIRTLQCLTDDENHLIIGKVNPSYLQIAFSYYNESFQEDGCKYANYNHLVQLFQFYLQKEQEITIYYLLHYNIAHHLILHLQYDQIPTLMMQMFFSMQQFKNIELYDQVWQYLFAAKYFQDLSTFLLHENNRSAIEDKIENKTMQMIESLKLQPDFTLSERISNNHESLNLVVEERVHLPIDIDLIKMYILKKTIKSLKFFQRKQGSSQQILTHITDTSKPDLMSHIRVAIEKSEEMENLSPQKKRQNARASIERLNSRDKIIILRRASKFFDDDDHVIGNNTTTHHHKMKIETKESEIIHKRSMSHQGQRMLIKSPMYPISFKDITHNRFDIELKKDQYQLDSLIKRETQSYNGIQILSLIIEQLIMQETNPLVKQKQPNSYLTMILGNDQGIFDTLFQIYIFKIKLSHTIKENSGYAAGKLVNLILKNKPQYCHLQENIKQFIDSICKAIIKSFEIDHQTISCDKIVLLDTLIILLSSDVKDPNLFNHVTSSTWSCLLYQLKISTTGKRNQTFQTQFLNLLKLTLQKGNELNYYTLFMKLNMFSEIKKISDIVFKNQVLDPKYQYLYVYLQNLLQIINQNLQARNNKEVLMSINTLETWKNLKVQYSMNQKQISSFYSVDAQKTTPTPQSLTQLRVRLRQSGYTASTKS